MQPSPQQNPTASTRTLCRPGRGAWGVLRAAWGSGAVTAEAEAHTWAEGRGNAGELQAASGMEGCFQ